MALKTKGTKTDNGFWTMFSNLGSPQPCVPRLVLGDLGCCLAGRDVGLTVGNTLSFKGLVFFLSCCRGIYDVSLDHNFLYLTSKRICIHTSNNYLSCAFMYL